MYEGEVGNESLALMSATGRPRSHNKEQGEKDKRERGARHSERSRRIDQRKTEETPALGIVLIYCTEVAMLPVVYTIVYSKCTTMGQDPDSMEGSRE